VRGGPAEKGKEVLLYLRAENRISITLLRRDSGGFPGEAGEPKPMKSERGRGPDVS